MKTLPAVILILVASSFGQVTHVFPATDTDNTFTGINSFTSVVLPNISGSTQCLQVNSVGQVSGTGLACGGGGGSVVGSGTSPHLSVWTASNTLGDTVVSYGANALTFNPTGPSWTMNSLASQLTIGTTATAGVTNDQITLQVGAGPTGVGGSDIRLFAGAAGSGATSGGNVEIDSGFNGSISGGKLTIFGASSPNTGGVRGIIQGGGGFWLSDDANGMYFRLTGSTGGGQVPIRVGSGVPAFNCGAPTVYLNSAAATASTFVYVCISGTTWTALTVP